MNSKAIYQDRAVRSPQICLDPGPLDPRGQSVSGHVVQAKMWEVNWQRGTGRMAEFIPETSYPPRRIIRERDISFKYKSEDKICSIICPEKYWNQSLSCGNFVKKPSTFRLDVNLETDNPSKTNYPTVGTFSRRTNRQISLRRILLHNSS